MENSVLRIVLVDRDATVRKEIKTLLAGTDSVSVDMEYADYEAYPESAEPPDVVLVGVDSDAESALDLITRLARQFPRCGTCAVSRSHDGQRILRAIRAGAKEFVTLPTDKEELIALLRSAAGRDAAQSQRARSCLMVAVAGAAGGVGATSLAANLGSILMASPERSVVLVDLDLTLGDADVYLDTTHEYTLADLTQNTARLDSELLRRFLTRHKSGLYLLPRPVDLSDASLVTPDALRRIFAILKTMSSHVLVDLSKSYSPLDMTAIECCDVVLLVTQLDLPCLRNVVRLLKSFRDKPSLMDKVKLVVNRSTQDSETIRLKRAEEIVGRQFFWQVPNDYRLMVEVRNNGVPLIEHAPKAEITQSLLALSRTLCGEEATSDKPAKPARSSAPGLGKWFGFLSSGAAKACSSQP